MVQVCVAFGSNLGDSQSTVHQAIKDVGALASTQLRKASSLYVSAPYQATGAQFVNAVAIYNTQLPALALLEALQDLERIAGRVRLYPNAPRTLDLDIIFYGDVVMDTLRLTLPHPRWQERAFVLKPLAEICPELVGQPSLEKVSNQEIYRL